MSESVVKIGPKFPLLARWGFYLTNPFFVKLFSFLNVYQTTSRYAKERELEFKRRVGEGETLYLIGISIAGHDTGASLIECSEDTGLKVIYNNHEERFTGKKQTSEFPVESLKIIKSHLSRNNISNSSIFNVFLTWDYSIHPSYGLRAMLEHFPLSMLLARPGAVNGSVEPVEIYNALSRKGKALATIGLPKKSKVIGVKHHESHAYSAFGLSPFSGQENTLVTAIDGTGDTGSTSIFLSNAEGNLDCLFENQSTTDSLGILYSMISSTQGGWPSLQSEGRYMGASAFGDLDRLTNPFYKRLRSIIYLGRAGQIFLNRKMIRYHFGGIYWAYAKPLKEILGEPIKLKEMWNPDAVLSVDDISHSEITQDRVDKAAALQLIFEDALVHVMHYWVDKTKATNLVMTGGTALNCIGNCRLIASLNNKRVLERFSIDKPISVWVPPVPCDTGIPIGAPLAFAFKAGVTKTSNLMTKPYVCGDAFKTHEIKDAVREDDTLMISDIGNINDSEGINLVSQLMAKCVGENGIIAIHQGPSETGPRALGNRSILANPSNKKALEIINSKVKYRERIRPLAPMVAIEKADELFSFPESAKIIDLSPYEHMTIAVMAKTTAKKAIPACVHVDGSSRVQLLRRSQNPLMHSYLKELEKIIGYPVSINTSFNVGSPIVHSPKQAISAFKKSKGMDAVIFISNSGEAMAVYRADNQNFKQSIEDVSK